MREGEMEAQTALTRQSQPAAAEVPVPEEGAQETPAVMPTGSEDQPEPVETSPDDRIRALEAELEAEKDRRLRALAELQNYRRRSQEERAQQLQYANQAILTDLIPVLDSFELAMSTTPTKESADAVDRGYEIIFQQLKDILARHGLVELAVDPGSFFDPETQEAVERVPTAEECEGTVVRVLRKGYGLHGRVLRPTQVAVAVPPSE